MASDYIYIPKVTDVFTEGSTLYDYLYPTSGSIKVGYISNTTFSLRLATLTG